MKIRKQVYDLTPSDLEKNPIWEFVLDEEEDEDQDESTVMPIDKIDEVSGLIILKTDFKTANGTRFTGYINLSDPEMDGEVSLGQMGLVQPVIATDGGQIGFWNGVLDLEKEEIDGVYEMLGTTMDGLFPIRFESVVEIDGRKISGSIPGFMIFGEGEKVRVRK